MAHDFKKFPELSNRQMTIYYFASPHKQITENFMAQVVRVKDGDTVELKADFRDFKFPLRLRKIDAPELKQVGGVASLNWLKDKVEGKEVMILINPRKRLEKWGRLMGDIMVGGELITEASLRDRQSGLFGILTNGEIPSMELWFK